MRQLDFHGQELRLIDADLARVALGCENTKRLMTIPGIDVTVAMSITAAVGDFSRFSSPNKLVRYLGLNPRVKQFGGQPASHGRITKRHCCAISCSRSSRSSRSTPARTADPRSTGCTSMILPASRTRTRAAATARSSTSRA